MAKELPAVKNSPASAGNAGSIHGLGRYPGKGNRNPLQYSCLGNSMDREVWRAAVHVVTKESDMTYRLNNKAAQITSAHSSILNLGVGLSEKTKPCFKVHVIDL